MMAHPCGLVADAASHVVTGTGKLVKTMVVEAADLAKYVASAAQVRNRNDSC